jgi:hypothetical protein
LSRSSWDDIDRCAVCGSCRSVAVGRPCAMLVHS